MPRLRTLVLATALAIPWTAAALDTGERVDDLELPSLAGGKAHLLATGTINVLVFAKPGHPHCLDTLRALASREGWMRAARWVVILPGDTVPAEARALASASGVRVPFLLDPGDLLYGRMAVKLHPTIFIVDREGRLGAYEPFREINYLDRVLARIRFMRGEITAAQLAEAEDPARSETHSDQGMARSRTQFGQKLMEMGQLDMALAEVQKSISASPTSFGYLLEGKILNRLGRCADASRAFEVVLKMDPKNGEVGAERRRPCPPKRDRSS
jgi:tetratricopeptide (TPR) repeat protein